MICPATTPCIQCSWVIMSQFGECDPECSLPQTVLTRTASCVCNDDSIASGGDEALCTATKPVTTKMCDANAACTTYDWFALAWDPCPIPCGLEPSIQTRTVTCVGSDGITYDDEALCRWDERPTEQYTCNPRGTQACVEYNWVAGTFGDCPTKCGLEQSVIVRRGACVGDDGSAAYDDSLCTDPKPDALDLCPDTLPCATTRWVITSRYDECPTACGLPQSALGRTVACVSTDCTLVVPVTGVCFEGNAIDSNMVCPPGGYKECTTDDECLNPDYDAASQQWMHCYLGSAEQTELTWSAPCDDAPEETCTYSTAQGYLCHVQ